MELFRVRRQTISDGRDASTGEKMAGKTAPFKTCETKGAKTWRGTKVSFETTRRFERYTKSSFEKKGFYPSGYHQGGSSSQSIGRGHETSSPFKVGRAEEESWQYSTWGGGCRDHHGRRRGFGTWGRARQYRQCTWRGDSSQSSEGSYSTSHGAFKERIEESEKGIQNGGREIEEWSRLGGYKHHYFEELEKSTFAASASDGRISQEVEEEEKGRQERSHKETHRGFHGGVEEGNGIQSIIIEEKEEAVDGWSDEFLQQQLQEFFRGRCIFRGDGRRDGDTDEEKVTRSSRINPSNVDTACARAAGTSSRDGPSGGEPFSGEWSEDPYLLYSTSQTCLSQSSEGTSRATSSCQHHGCSSSRRSCKSGQRLSRKIYSNTSEFARLQLERRQTHGIVSFGRIRSGKQQHGVSNTETHPTGCQDAGELVRRLSRSWSRLSWRMAIRKMSEGRWRKRKRQRQERKERQGQRQWQLQQRVEGLERETGGENLGLKEAQVENGPAPILPDTKQFHYADFYETARLATDLRKLGCVVAWWLEQCIDVSSYLQNSRFLRTVFTSDMWQRASSSRLALPIREGELKQVRIALKEIPLAKAVTEDFIQQWSQAAWTYAACYVVNLMYGSAAPLSPGGWNQAEKRVATAIEGGVRRLLHHGRDCIVFDELMEKELKSRRVNYQGEEVGICHKLSLDQVLPALPPKEHGGCIEAISLVSNHTKYMLMNPNRCVVDDKGQVLPKLQARVHVQTGEIDDIARELVQRNVCDWVPLESVFRFRGEPVLNGLFGAPKPTTLEDGRPILRLIMNLVPSNSIMRGFTGAVKNSPSITSWMSTVVDDGDEIQVWQSDMCNAFYLFRLPDSWMYFLAFNVIREGHEVGADFRGKVALACKVLPMGWLSSVSVMQEMSEAILKVRALDETSQIIRNKAVPLWMVGIARESFDKSRNWWHIYLDNFAAGETISPGQTYKGGDHLHEVAEFCWSEVGVLSSEKKRKRAVQEAQELGAFIDGKKLSIGGSPERFLRLAHATFWTLHQKHLSKKVVQVILGRWVHVMQFRRPSMSLINIAWDFVSKKTMSDRRIDDVRRELFSCVAAIPLLHTFLGSQISRVITASDASTKGGAVGIAHDLTSVGVDYTNGAIANQMTQSDIPVLVISLFNGIGGAFRAYDILGVRPKGLISFDTHKPANRVTSRRWPHAEILEDVRSFSRDFLRDVLARYLGIVEIHLWAGFP